MSADLEKLRGTFKITGGVLRGMAFTTALPDGTKISIVAGDMEGIGAALDALGWEGELVLEKIQPVVIAAASALSTFEDLEDDIPF